MINFTRRRLTAFLLGCFLSGNAAAGVVSIPQVNMQPSLGGVGGPLIQLPGTASPLLLMPAMPQMTPMLSVMPSPVFTPSPVVHAAASLSAATPIQRMAPTLEALERSVNPSQGDQSERRDLFTGARDHSGVLGAPPGRSEAAPKGFLKNADGVWVGGRTAELATWINGLYAELSQHVDLSDVINVMNDAYDEGRAKLRSVEQAATDHKIVDSSVHLEGTRNWVDAILVDAHGFNIAVQTHRVFFHPARDNPASEISEGIRRVDAYLEKAKRDFAAGGRAEQNIGKKFARVEMNFDTRGYKAIEDHLRGKEKEFKAAFGDRFVFHYITEPRMESVPLRAEYNRLVEKYWGQPEGVMGILDGVTYSREVGVGHELNSHKMRMKMGLKVTQAGRDFFGEKTLPDGRVIKEYKTEFDAVTEPVADGAKPLKDRDVVLWEDKSVRVWMPLKDVMEDTFLYKLKIYRDNRAIIEAGLGGAPLKVAFSVDVGGLDREAAQKGLTVWRDPRQKALMEYLQASAPALSAEYGFPVSFIFVNSHPGERPDLFNQKPIDGAQWRASQAQDGR